MKYRLIYLILLLLAMVLGACSPGSPAKPNGPVLVMFYTDN